MDPFAAALDALFSAPGSAAAVYAGNVGTISGIRVIVSRPDAMSPFGDSRVILPTMSIEVRRSDVEQPEVGDVFTIDEDAYRVSAEPMLDVEGLTWTCAAEPDR